MRRHISTRRLLPLLLATLSALPVTANGDDTLPAESVIMPGVDEASMRTYFDQAGVQPLEGLWEFPDDNMVVAIEERRGEAHGHHYTLMLVSSDNLEMLPGTIIGSMTSTADPSKLCLWLYSERSHITLTKPMECVATLSDNGTTLLFDPPHLRLKVRVNFARFLPSIFGKLSIYPDKHEEKAPTGFKKIYPANGNGEQFNEIRYL